jgi:prepilin peptidase CpaA
LLRISSFSFVVLVVGVLIATVVDLRTRRVPNVLTAAMAAVGLGLAAAGLSGVSLGMALLGLVVGLAVMLPGHVIGATGAGDVKLMAAVGALVGPSLAFKAFLFTALAGGALAVIVAVRRRRLNATVAGTARMIATPLDAPREIQTATRASRFAYAPAIAVGSVLATLVG